MHNIPPPAITDHRGQWILSILIVGKSFPRFSLRARDCVMFSFHGKTPPRLERNGLFIHVLFGLEAFQSFHTGSLMAD
jgi:hypothetical protein